MEPNVICKKITGKTLLERACSYTVGGMVSVRNMQKFYKSEHSPIRTQIFCIELLSIPSFVSTHLVRHHVGVMHFVQSMREDRGATEVANRQTPVHHMMVANAQGLLDMAKKRLCTKCLNPFISQVNYWNMTFTAEDCDSMRSLNPFISQVNYWKSQWMGQFKGGKDAVSIPS